MISGNFQNISLKLKSISHASAKIYTNRVSYKHGDESVIFNSMTSKNKPGSSFLRYLIYLYSVNSIHPGIHYLSWWINCHRWPHRQEKNIHTCLQPVGQRANKVKWKKYVFKLITCYYIYVKFIMGNWNLKVDFRFILWI